MSRRITQGVGSDDPDRNGVRGRIWLFECAGRAVVVSRARARTTGRRAHRARAAGGRRDHHHGELHDQRTQRVHEGGSFDVSLSTQIAAVIGGLPAGSGLLDYAAGEVGRRQRVLAVWHRELRGHRRRDHRGHILVDCHAGPSHRLGQRQRHGQRVPVDGGALGDAEPGPRGRERGRPAPRATRTAAPRRSPSPGRRRAAPLLERDRGEHDLHLHRPGSATLTLTASDGDHGCDATST